MFITTNGAANMAAMVQDFEYILQDPFIHFVSADGHIM